jgi:UV DNA damage endonuclease
MRNRGAFMKIGYPCVNLTVGCSSSHTFRLASYSEAMFIETVKRNLECLKRILESNAHHGVLFFRITSDLVPFASHPICKFNWPLRFRDEFGTVGDIIKEKSMRISMHPDQFVLVNAKDDGIFLRSVKDLEYHVRVLDLLGLDNDAKVQIHVGGVYGDRKESVDRFVKRYSRLDEVIRRRLVIENDDVNYDLGECLAISHATGVPVIFDTFHHQIKGNGRDIGDCLSLTEMTWANRDGLPMVDYSSQEPAQRKGKHARTLDGEHFLNFLKRSKPHDFDLMMEIKDKEMSASRALALAEGDPRLRKRN